MIKFEYSPTKIDFIKTFWTIYFQNKQNRLVPFFGIFFFFCFLLAAFGSHDFRLGTDSDHIPILAVLLFFILLFGPFSTNLLQAFLINGMIFNQPVRCEAGNEHILFQKNDGLAKWNWPFFSKKIENRKYFILLSDQKPRNFYFIPKRAFLSADDKNRFAELLEVKILPKPRETSSLKNKLNFKSPEFNLDIFIRILLIIIMVILVLINVIIGFRNSQAENNLMFIAKGCLFL